MNARQKRFADEYLVDCNATQAAIRAGYSPKTARQVGSENLTKLDIKAYIEEQLERIHSERTADAQEVVEYLSSVMRGESESEVVVVVGMGDGVSDAERVTKRPDERERLKAAEILARIHGIANSVSVSGPVPVVISGGEDLEG